jgi:hypothetical protein
VSDADAHGVSLSDDDTVEVRQQRSDPENDRSI